MLLADSRERFSERRLKLLGHPMSCLCFFGGRIISWLALSGEEKRGDLIALSLLMLDSPRQRSGKKKAISLAALTYESQLCTALRVVSIP
jgi:hypothetical protein